MANFFGGKLPTQNSLHRMLSTTCTRVQASPVPKKYNFMDPDNFAVQQDR